MRAPPSPGSAADLEKFINDEMPRSAPNCQGTGAELTGTYIRSRQQPIVEMESAPQVTAIDGVRTVIERMRGDRAPDHVEPPRPRAGRRGCVASGR